MPKIINLALVKESAKNNYSEVTEVMREQIIKEQCPSHYGFENSNCMMNIRDCEKCWNREVEAV